VSEKEHGKCNDGKKQSIRMMYNIYVQGAAEKRATIKQQ
jgi:hypothetical protein